MAKNANVYMLWGATFSADGLPDQMYFSKVNARDRAFREARQVSEATKTRVNGRNMNADIRWQEISAMS